MSDPTATILVASPVGTLELCASDSALTSLTIRPDARPSGAETDHPVLRAAVRQLDEYFAGERQEFTIPLAPLKSKRGAVLRAGIASVPYGETLSYGALANILESAARAVGQACSRNPFPIIIPCHRVTSSNGAPENYSGGDGIKTKAWLNAFERKNKEI